MPPFIEPPAPPLPPSSPSFPSAPAPPSMSLPPPESQVHHEPQRSGLFSTLLGDPVVLYQAHLEHPELFNPETSQLLTDLLTLRKSVPSLTQPEMDLLDRATVDFAQHRPVRKSKRPKAPPVTPHIEEEDDEEPELEWEGDKPRLPHLELPDGVL
jgi:hypothetical protein